MTQQLTAHQASAAGRRAASAQFPGRLSVSRVFASWSAVSVLAYCNMPCQTGSACSNVTGLVWTVNNTDYCCQDSSVKPHMTLLPNITCTCSVDPYAGLPLGEQIKLWATLNMDEGRFCQYGDKACYGSPYNITANDDKLKFCCRKPPYLSRRITFTVVEYEFVGCLCTGDHPPARSAPEYVVPSAWGQYNSSGEECYFNQDCDDYPIQKCVERESEFLMYATLTVI
nr:hypothetical protein BaRGS_027506 [Batillaria attramentaria]